MIATALATAALAVIPAPNAQIIAEPCPAAAENAGTTDACAYPDGRVYLPPGSTEFMREHELGHVFDAQRLDDGERNKLKRLMQIPAARAWRTDDPFQASSERFADVYAACRLQLDPDHRWESSYDYIPSARRFKDVCATISRAADLEPQRR